MQDKKHLPIDPNSGTYLTDGMDLPRNVQLISVGGCQKTVAVLGAVTTTACRRTPTGDRSVVAEMDPP